MSIAWTDSKQLALSVHQFATFQCRYLCRWFLLDKAVGTLQANSTTKQTPHLKLRTGTACKQLVCLCSEHAKSIDLLNEHHQQNHHRQMGCCGWICTTQTKNPSQTLECAWVEMHGQTNVWPPQPHWLVMFVFWGQLKRKFVGDCWGTVTPVAVERAQPTYQTH